MKIICFFSALLCFSRSVIIRNAWNPEKYKLPANFRYGVSSSAYQIEGAWNEDGKGESIWDRYFHTHPEEFAPGPNGDEACDSYHQHLRDVDMLRELGVDYYRFSVSWSRILPTGFANNINFKGLEYYQNLTEELHSYKIESMVTMYYNDLPQAIQDLGGWTNPNIIHWFKDYAAVLFRYLPLVNYWIPIHDPSVCFEMYDGIGKMPPNIDAKGVGDYKCVKNMLLAHAKVYRYFEKKSKATNKTMGLVGMSVAMNWADPLNYNNTNEKLAEATQIFREFTIDLYVHPIYSKEGGFPKVVQQIVSRNSKSEGLPRSRLPDFTKEEKKLLKGASDFLGLNHYTTYFINAPKPGKEYSYVKFPIDAQVKVTQSETWMKSKTSWLKSAPYGFHRICIYLNKRYNHPAMLITEFGWSTDPGRRDAERVEIITEFLKAMVFALTDGADLRGFTISSLMDGIEGTAGTTERFGLYDVDFNSPIKKRSPKLSAHYLRQLIDTSLIKEKWEPYSDDLSLSISSRRLEKQNKTET